MRIRSAAPVVLLALSAASAGAQGTNSRLRGTVIDASTAQPIVGARVVVAATGRFALTDSTGAFELGQLPSGILRFLFVAQGFPRSSVVLAFAASEVMTQ